MSAEGEAAATLTINTRVDAIRADVTSRIARALVSIGAIAG
jgi:hypothetical protein